MLAAQVPCLALNVVELAEELQRFLGEGALVVDPQIVEFPARVRKTPNLDHALSEQPLVPRVVVADELAAPAVEEVLGMRRAAALSEVVHDGVQGIELGRAVAPDVCAVRLALAGDQHRDRCFVSVQNRTLEQCRPQRIDQGLQAHAADSDPLGECRARYGQAGPLEDPFLSIQWLMIGVFGHQHLREQPSGGQPLVDHMGRYRRLDQRLALRTCPLATNVPLNMEDARRVVELLAHVLADALHRATATAHGSFRLVPHFDPRQVRRQWRPFRLVLGRLRRRPGSQRRELRTDCFEIRVDGLLEQAPLPAV